jgi:hypothetical protein
VPVFGPLDRLPAVVGRVQREIVLARFIGKLVVDQSIREARQRVGSVVAGLGADRDEQDRDEQDRDEQDRDEQDEDEP